MKALTVELFLGVLALAAVDGCTARKAEPEPAPIAPAASTPPQTPMSEPLPLATAPASDKPIGQAAVDAGIEHAKPKTERKSGAQAACGAGGCSADMKKGTK